VRTTAFARGLYSLVDALEMGRGLSDLSETMAATIEISDLLGLTKIQQQEIGATTGPNLQPIPLFTVPADKVWRVRAWSARVATGAGVTTAGTVIGVKINNQVGPGSYIAALSDDAALPVSSTRHLCARNLPLLLPPGAILCAYGSQAGGAPSFESLVMYEEFDA